MLRRDRVVEPVASWGLDLGQTPPVDALLFGRSRVDLETAVELGLGHLLGAGREIHGFTGARGLPWSRR